MQTLLKNFKQRYWNQKGSTIIQVLMLAGVFSFVAMAVARLIFLNRNMVQEVSSRMNVETLHAQIFAQLLDDQSCFNTFSAVTKAANQAVPVILDNASLPVFSSGQRYVTNVTIRSMTLTAYTYDATTAFPPFDALARLTIVYRIPYGEAQAKDFERFMFIRTKNMSAPGAWPDGAAMAEGTIRCVASAPAGSPLASGGLNMSTNLSKRYSDVKNSDMRIERFGGVRGRLLLNGNLLARGVFTLSDANKKRDISPIKLDFNNFSKIGSYRFKWKNSDGESLGYKAREVKSIFPELVSKRTTDKFYQVDYFGEIPLILEGVKAMDKENFELEKEISRLESKYTKRSRPREATQ